ncbi:MAG: amidohydrolase family protein, partial [Actinobacteria bacterium]|nr:amidohydrolase family protein [Actinomycetota bacterium]NIU65593.1 amidohydrolase family protein [Actinomycetota bacterium]NIV86525.1 amidohydrolase family protein [Actinomycetota bacterium]NIW27400.1 amidohydrolase family protein [Actinomycetota bacterium]NIX19927.1 amidohydrolase family protein [Actinomycetota bacterium]
GDLVRALDDLGARGLGEIHAMISPDSSMWCGPRDEMAMLSRIGLPMRVRVFAITDLPDTLDRMKEAAGGDLRFGGWKGFADGALGARTAALSEPYADGPGAGTPRWGVGSHRACAERALELGGSVAIHAIGDAAVDRVLDLFEALRSAGADPSSLRIEHASVIRPDAIVRMAELGVTASVQPAFVRSDGPWLPDRLGPRRLAWAHPFRSMSEAGIPLLGGSDAPVEVPDPWQAMADARTRPYLPGGESLDA